ncbi:hypothetical protein FJNA_07250 [Thermus sp. FJN-A]
MAWERVVALLALALGAAALGLSFGLPQAQGPGPELFPRLLGVVLLFAGAGELLLTKPGKRREGLAGWGQGLVLLLLFLVAPTLVSRLGLAPTAALAAGLGAFLAQESLLRSLLVALFTWFLAYMVFVRLLGVPA